MSLKVQSNLKIYDFFINCELEDKKFFKKLIQEEFIKLNSLELEIFSKIGSLKSCFMIFLNNKNMPSTSGHILIISSNLQLKKMT